jgi:glycosyltransferase involved in cell wall biosynthesis
MVELPRVTFGIIVLNGEPFTRYCLRALYPFAHEIIVVEGACKAATAIATPDGHSTDGTLETLSRFKAEEDPEDKVQIIVRDGFWSEKDEQSQAYAERATGDYLWQVDIDEFYQPENMRTVLEMLHNDPQITAVSFKQVTFWGGFDYITDSWYLRKGGEIFHRLFKWGRGYRYVTHRPPTVHDPQGRDLRNLTWVNGYELARHGVLLYHYSLTFPKQVLDKCNYYSQAEWATHARSAQEWAKRNFLRLEAPFRVHNVYTHPSWLERFHGTHPPAIQQLHADIKAGKIEIELRQNNDVEALLHSRWYRLGRIMLKTLEPVDAWGRPLVRLSLRAMRRALRFVPRVFDGG